MFRHLWALAIYSCQNMRELSEHAAPDCVFEHLNSLLALLEEVLNSNFGNVWFKTLVNQFLLSYNFEAIRIHLHQVACSQSILCQASISIECE